MSNTKYSEKNWETISSIPYLTVLLMTTAVYSGVEGTRQELQKGAKSIAEGRLSYPENELILSIIPNGDSINEVIEKTIKKQKEIINKYRITNKEDLGLFQKKVFGIYEDVIYNINKIETGVSVNEFKRWLLYIAEEVAVAAIEGFGITQNADPFSEEEREIFKKIDKALRKI